MNPGLAARNHSPNLPDSDRHYPSSSLATTFDPFTTTALGTWTFEATYNNHVFTRQFTVAATVLGDLDGDKTVGMPDAVLALRILAGLEAAPVQGADYDADGVSGLTLGDALYMLREAAGNR